MGSVCPVGRLSLILPFEVICRDCCLCAIAIGLLVFPLSGLLGDAVLGRYRVIKCSLRALWVSIIIHSLADALVHIYQVNGSRTWSIVSDSFLYLWGAGCGLFLINCIHFGIDQLVDAPSRQISSYISWYCWCFFMTDVIEILVLECTYYPWWNTIRLHLSSPLHFAWIFSLIKIWSKSQHLQILLS